MNKESSNAEKKETAGPSERSSNGAHFGMTIHKEKAAGLKAAATETTSKSMTEAGGPACQQAGRKLPS
jgi:hypothetical protein